MLRSLSTLELIALFGTLCAAQPPASSGIFRSRTDLVALDVSVENGAGQFVPSLAADEFLVLENNVPQNVTFFSADNPQPLAVALLVDHSQSMAGEHLDRVKAAADAFLRALPADDLVEVLGFNDVTMRLSPLGVDHAAAEQSIRDLSSSGGTALFDTMRVALNDLDRARIEHPADYRKVVVAFSDGEDTFSREPFEDLLEAARRGTVTFDAISIRTDEHGHWLAPPHDLAQLASDTGGRAIAVRSLEDLATVSAGIGAELSHRYRIGYVSSSTGGDSGWRQISVRLANKDLVARTRAGYFAQRSSPGRY